MSMKDFLIFVCVDMIQSYECMCEIKIEACDVCSCTLCKYWNGWNAKNGGVELAN